MAIQDEGEGEGGYTSRVGYSMYLSGLKKTMVGKGVFLTRKETRARLGLFQRTRQFLDGGKLTS